MESDFEKQFELNDRCGDALVLAYSPQNVLGRDAENSFYIPSSGKVESAFGYSLRKLFGKKEGRGSWSDNIVWDKIENLDKLESRIKEGVWGITSGDRDYKTTFENYLSIYSGKFASHWIYGKGTLYRFLRGKRKNALQSFEEYWDSNEKEQWKKIHKFMKGVHHKG